MHEAAHRPRGVAAVPDLASGGEPLAGSVRAELQRGLGYDLGRVRVHTDGRAGASARRLAAAAYTVGDHIAFAPGRYRPDTPAGRELLAHELAHVVQGRRSGTAVADGVADPGDPAERRAAEVAASVAAGRPARDPGPATAQLHRTPETWFRGEAVGVGAAQPGAFLHDLGEGLYLTDNAAVASSYAATRAGVNPAAARTLVATLDPKLLGRVLDLTTDVRWQAFVQTRTPAGVTYEQLIKLANENYGRFFQDFVRIHRIRLESFDAIKGPEYVRGGTQLCIRNPQIQAQVRSLLAGAPAETAVAEGAAVEGAAAVRSAAAATEAVEVVGAAEGAAVAVSRGSRALALGGRIAAGLVRGAIFAALVLGLDYLKRRSDRQRFEADMRTVERQVAASMQGLLPRARELQRTADGRTVWAHLVIEINSTLTLMMDPMGGGAGSYESFDGVRFGAATVGLDYQESRRHVRGEALSLVGPLAVTTVHPDTERVVSSVPVPYDAETLDPAGVRRRIQFNEADAGRPGLPQHVLDALFEEREALLRRAARTSSPAPPDFFLDRLFSPR